jgi:ubiquinone/menaquinone biosynthesis C-methylase UbiE
MILAFYRCGRERKKRNQIMNDEIASAYNRWSQTYEAVENPTRDLAAARVRQERLPLHNRDALELGCGTGLNTKYLAQHCRRVTALDFSFGMLEQARANVSADNVDFAQSDLRLPWAIESDSIDFILCTLVLEHIADLRHIFNEARRVMRAGGEILIYELHPFRQMQGGQAQFADADSGETVFIHAFLHNVSEYVNAMIETGFELMRLGEWRTEEDLRLCAPPRLLSIHARVRK